MPDAQRDTGAGGFVPHANAGRKRKILITGVSRFLGLRVAQRLARSNEVELLVGVDLEEPPSDIEGLEFVRADIRSPLIARVVEATKVDVIVHTNISSSRAAFAGRSQMKENNVIGTLQLLAVAQRAERVRKVVMRSSTAVYGFSPSEPSLLTEDHAARVVHLAGFARDCAEAETIARDFGRRRPGVDLTILRMQPVIGPTVSTGLTDYLSLTAVPTVLGFDPRLQLLHEADAVDVLCRAVHFDAGGIFNVAAEGVLYLSQAIRMLGRAQIPLPPPAPAIAAMVLRRLGVLDFSVDQLELLVRGRVVSTRRAKEVLGFAPRLTTKEALIDFRDNRAEGPAPRPNGSSSWERELFEYLRARSTASV
ncbi:MAG TPA: NAD-dependent epimerase/dehydratase family protein [Actinomycetota bacterium]|jgi:UDP-glucose 4-epimerase|nr:NAD-dependent epimerase/dehydratase family protein [Actinomycetota bacterium]